LADRKKEITVEKKVAELLKESIKVKEGMLGPLARVIADIARVIIASVKDGGKVIIFGNGGSAADSQHIAAELVGRFKKERAPIPAIALTTNTSSLTALSNDYGYDASFKRQLEALGAAGDCAIGISTSGNARNVELALNTAKEMGLKVITMTGSGGGKISAAAHIALKIPSDNTPRIQEAHITAAHIICELVEESMIK